MKNLRYILLFILNLIVIGVTAETQKNYKLHINSTIDSHYKSLAPMDLSVNTPVALLKEKISREVNKPATYFVLAYSETGNDNLMDPRKNLYDYYTNETGPFYINVYGKEQLKREYPGKYPNIERY